MESQTPCPSQFFKQVKSVNNKHYCNKKQEGTKNKDKEQRAKGKH